MQQYKQTVKKKIYKRKKEKEKLFQKWLLCALEHFRAIVKDLTFKMPNFFHKLNEFYILTNGDDDDKIAIIATTGNKTEWCIFL